MTILSVLNLKGGCAKTSTIVHLGGCIAENKMRPLLIDLDPQQSAMTWARQSDKFPFPVVSLSAKSAGKIKTEIEALAKEHKADTILLDTPPQLEDVSLISAMLSDIILVPVSPSALDIWAAQEAIKTIREARAERGGKLPKIVLVPSRVLTRSSLGRDIADTLKAFGEPVSPAISSRVAIAESAIAGLPISVYAPKSAGHNEFLNLWKFVSSEIRK